MIFTSYFAKMQYIEKDMVPIAITAIVPQWYNGLVYTNLAPTVDILMEYKRTGDRDRYIERYNTEVLDRLDPLEVYSDLMYLSDSKPVCLVCYEKTDSFCHRHLVADWLTKNGYECKETYIGG